MYKRQLLEKELRRLEETLALPVLDGWGQTGTTREPLQVKFTLYRLSRDDPDEQMLVDMLLHSCLLYTSRRAELKLSGQQPFFGGIRTGGRRMSVQNVQAALKKLAARAGIQQRVSPHVLRHTYATRALDSGLTIREVQSLLGHSDVSTTMILSLIHI